MYLSFQYSVCPSYNSTVCHQKQHFTLCGHVKNVCIFMHSKTLVEPNCPPSIHSSGIFAGAAGYFLENKEIRTILWEVTCSK